MTIHQMHLHKSPFNMIKSGQKRVEIRLYDEKRRKLRPGDRILFTDISSSGQHLTVVITSLHIYPSFAALFADISPSDLGNSPEMTLAEAVSMIRKYYRQEDETQFGVVGIYFTMMDNETTEEAKL